MNKTGFTETIKSGPLRIEPLDTANPKECERWQSCQLAIYANNRIQATANGLEIDAAEREDLEKRALGPAENLIDVARADWVICFWVVHEEKRVGIVSVERPLPGIQPFLRVFDLYIAPSFRGTGLGFAVLDALRDQAEHNEFVGITLHTEWCWPRPLRYFLNCGFWVSSWKRYLTLVLLSGLPPYEIRETNGRLEFWIRPDAGDTLLYSAVRNGDWLEWDETDAARSMVNDPTHFYEWHYGRCTFALELALRGWPLIRDPGAWNERTRWSDSGMPEGLADKILIFERIEREKGFGCERFINLPAEIQLGPTDASPDKRWPG